MSHGLVAGERRKSAGRTFEILVPPDPEKQSRPQFIGLLHIAMLATPGGRRRLHDAEGRATRCDGITGGRCWCIADFAVVVIAALRVGCRNGVVVVVVIIVIIRRSLTSGTHRLNCPPFGRRHMEV